MDTLSSSPEAVTEISVAFTSSVVPTKQYLTFEKFLSHNVFLGITKQGYFSSNKYHYDNKGKEYMASM